MAFFAAIALTGCNRKVCKSYCTVHVLKYSWGIWLSQKLQARKSSFLVHKNLKIL